MRREALGVDLHQRGAAGVAGRAGSGGEAVDAVLVVVDGRRPGLLLHLGEGIRHDLPGLRVELRPQPGADRGERHRVGELRGDDMLDDLVPLPPIGGHGVGDGAVDDALLERRQHLAERHRDAGPSGALDVVAQRRRVDADLLALQILDAHDGLGAVDQGRRPRVQRHHLGVERLLEGLVDGLPVGLVDLAHGREVLRHAGEVGAFDQPVALGDVSDQAVGEVEHVELEEPDHLVALEARLGDRDRLRGQLAAGRLREHLGPERALDLLPRGEVTPGTDHLELPGRNLGAGENRCARKGRGERGRCHHQKLSVHVLLLLVRRSRFFDGSGSGLLCIGIVD